MEGVYSLVISYSGRTLSLDLPASSPTSSLQDACSTRFDVAPAAQKLIHKGKQLNLRSPSSPLSDILPPPPSSTTSPPLKLLLVGPPSSSLSALQAAQATRAAKSSAFAYHAAHPHAPVRNTSRPTLGAGDEQWRFHELKPFGEEVPQIEVRRKMLERLSEDKAVRHVMKEEKFVVGVLTELHPHRDPTLLGLNRNAGQEICLRLLTDDLTGTRSYLDVRKVLLHELAHNRVSPHNDDFKELNSALNRAVADYELSHGLSHPGAAPCSDAWEPTGPDSDLVPRSARRLDEQGEPERRSVLRYDEEELLDERRERMRMAAEARAEREKERGRG